MQIQILVRIPSEQKDALDRLKKLTMVPTAVRIREAIGILLEGYAEVLEPQLVLPGVATKPSAKDAAS